MVNGVRGMSMRRRFAFAPLLALEPKLLVPCKGTPPSIYPSGRIRIRNHLPVVNMEMLQEPYKIVECFPGPEGQSKFALIEMPDGSGYLFTYSYVKKTSVQERELAKTIASSIRDHVLIIDNKRRAGFLQLKSFDNYNTIARFKRVGANQDWWVHADSTVCKLGAS